MDYIKIFEKFKKERRIYKHLDKGKEGISEISKKIEPRYVEIRNPIKTLKNVVDDIKNRMGLKKEIKYLDSGMWGMAFKVGRKVIKLTSNREEVGVAKKLIGKKIPNVVNYYELIKIEEYSIWAILMDFAEPLSKREQSIIQKIESCLDIDELIEEIEGTDIKKSEAKKIWREYKDLEESLENSGISTADMHWGNIGRIGGKLVHFDIMPETGKDDVSKLSR